MPPLYLARHAETVFNRGARMQGHMAHTPLTRAGFAQADAMGAALAAAIPDAAGLDLWSSPSGRTLQTMAIVCDHLDRDFFDIRADAALLEIDVGQWEGRRYGDIIAEQGAILDTGRRLFNVPIPGGETYEDIAVRLCAWLPRLSPDRPALVISHGMTARVLRGLLVGGEPFGATGTVIAPDAPQGTAFRIVDGQEEPVIVGTGVSSLRVALSVSRAG